MRSAPHLNLPVWALLLLLHFSAFVPAARAQQETDDESEFSGDAGSLWINGTLYHLRQVHWHSPSEHRLNGRRYSPELHMVHLSAENKAAVIGLLYNIGSPDHFLQQLEPYLRRMADMKEKEEKVGVVARSLGGEGRWQT